MVRSSSSNKIKQESKRKADIRSSPLNLAICQRLCWQHVRMSIKNTCFFSSLSGGESYEVLNSRQLYLHRIKTLAETHHCEMGDFLPVCAETEQRASRRSGRTRGAEDAGAAVHSGGATCGGHAGLKGETEFFVFFVNVCCLRVKLDGGGGEEFKEKKVVAYQLLHRALTKYLHSLEQSSAVWPAHKGTCLTLVCFSTAVGSLTCLGR